MRTLITKYRNKTTTEIVFSLGYNGFTKMNPIFQMVNDSNTLVYVGEKSEKELKEEYVNLGTSVARNIRHRIQ